jgi:hypothetical protein
MPRLRALALSATLLLANACAAPAVTPPAPPPAPAPPAPPAPPPPTPPAQLTAGGMPDDTQLYLEIPGLAGILGGIQAAVGDVVAKEALASVAKELGVSEDEAQRLAGAVASIHVGGRKQDGQVRVAISIHLSDAKPVQDLVAHGALHDKGACGAGCQALATRSSPKGRVFWLAQRGLLVVGDEPMQAAVVQVSEGRTPELSKIPRTSVAAKERWMASAFVAPALLEELASHKVSFPAPLVAAWSSTKVGLHGRYEASIAAQGLQGAVPLAPPRALAIARRLPAETASYLALSTGIPGGASGARKLLAQVVALLGPKADRAVDNVEGALSMAQLRLADVLGALGDEGVIGVSVRPGVSTKKAMEKAYAVVIVQELSDQRPAEAILKAAREALRKNKKKATVRPEGSGFSATLKGAPVPFMRAKLLKGALFLGLGEKDLVDRAMLAVDRGKGTLGDSAAHANSLSALPRASALRVWVDLARAFELASVSMRAEQRAPFEALRRAQGASSQLRSAIGFTATIEDERVHLALDEVNGVGTLGALAIFGVRRYLSAAKAAEAKNTIGAIGRGAVMAYEREQLGPSNAALHKLCKSAIPVPSKVPRGTKVLPAGGQDFDTGDQERGWRCLKFTITEPIRYQYTYTVGGPYKGPKRGGPDPGPNGFEIAAEGDLDGDGVTSLFTLVGVVDPKTDMVRLSKQIWSDREDE